MPRLLDIRITVRYRSDDGYVGERTVGAPGDMPERVLFDAACELARVADVFGFGERVTDGAVEGRQRAANAREMLEAGSRRERAALFNRQGR